MIAASRGRTAGLNWSAAAASVSAARSLISASPTVIPNDGSTTSTITITVLDILGNPVVGATVVLSSTGSNNTITQPGATNSSGVTTGTIKSTTGEAKTVSAVANGIALASTVAVTVSASNVPDPTNCTVTGDDTVVALGDVINVTVQAKKADNTNITVGGATVVGTQSGSNFTLSAVTDNGDGTYSFTATVISSVVTSATIGATINAATITDTETITRVAPIFYSDFAAGDILDGSKWTGKVNNADARLSIIASTGRDFVAAKCMKVEHPASPNTGFVYKTGLGTLAIGETRFYRIKYRNEVDDAEGDKSSNVNSCHPLETASTSNWSTGFGFEASSKNNGSFPWRLDFPGETGNVQQRWSPGSVAGGATNLSKLETYRFEWSVKRISANEYELHIRIYDHNGNLTGDSGIVTVTPPRVTLATYSGTSTITIDDAVLDAIRIGTNGGQWTFTTSQYIYWGELCIRSDDWCGQYNSTDG